MSLKRTQREVDSAEFSEWLAVREYEAELMGLIEPELTPEDVGAKLQAWAAVHNAKQAAKKR